MNVAGALPTPTTAQTTATGFMYFEVPKGHKVAGWSLVLGTGGRPRKQCRSQEPMTPRLAGDPSSIGKSVNYDNGGVVATVVNVAAGCGR